MLFVSAVEATSCGSRPPRRLVAWPMPFTRALPHVNRSAIMHKLRLLSLAPLGLALATMFASTAEAQRRTQVVICRDGSRFDTDNASVCNRHRGVDGRATENARRYEADRVANGRGNGRWDDRNS